MAYMRIQIGLAFFWRSCYCGRSANAVMCKEKKYWTRDIVTTAVTALIFFFTKKDAICRLSEEVPGFATEQKPSEFRGRMLVFHLSKMKSATKLKSNKKHV